MKSSATHWFPFDNTARTDYVMQVSRTKMHFTDNYASVAGIEDEESEGFYLTRQPSRPLPYKNNWQNSITFELSMDRKDYTRKVYSILDFFSDVGGLFGAIRPIFTIVLGVISFWSSYQFLMGDLFVESNQESASPLSKSMSENNQRHLKSSKGNDV